MTLKHNQAKLRAVTSYFSSSAETETETRRLQLHEFKLQHRTSVRC
jgi:hypothetical protein